MSAVKELSEVVEFVCALAGALAAAADDGKISIVDVRHLAPLLYKFPSAIDGLGDITLADLSQEDLDSVADKVKEALDLKNDRVEAAIEDAIDIALQIYALVKKLRA